MNKVKITKEQIIETGLYMAKENGLSSINIRSLAKRCEVSVGCIYYYYDNKSELIIDIITMFWNDVFKPIINNSKEAKDFIVFLKYSYNSIYEKLGESNIYINSHMNMFTESGKSDGAESMTNYIGEIISHFNNILIRDEKVKSDIWDDELSQKEFLQFVFDNMFQNLDKKRKNIDFLCVMIEKIIY